MTSSNAVPSSSVSFSRWSRICRCTVTSSADVGSSAISRSGRQASAMAMSTRWRIPPENSCGYCLARRAGSGIPAWPSSSTACRHACRRVHMPCASRVSATWRPTRDTGLRFDIGSCGTRPISRPRNRRNRRSPACVMSSPRQRIVPPVTRPPPGSRPMTACAVVDFPEPDWPTTATRSPGASVSDTPRTAGVSPKDTARSLIPAEARSSSRSSGRVRRAGRRRTG